MKLVALIFSLITLSILISTSNSAVLVKNRAIIADENGIVFLPFVTNPESAIERDALMALYNSTNGSSWTRNSGWGVGYPCDPAWYRVTCESGHVQWLQLHFNQLSGSIPAELGNLSRLESLNLNSNQLSGPIPSTLGDLSSLKGLSLGNNQLSGPIPAELGELSRLVILALDYNQLSEPIPAELGELSALDVLDLTGNQLSGPIPAELGNLSRLYHLYLGNNQLSGPIPAELSNLSSLHMLDLNDNPALVCWQTKAALIWAQGLDYYSGPDTVCS